MVIPISDIRKVAANERGYNIITALRGPDFQTLNSSRMKTIFTARLRCFLQCTRNVRDYPIEAKELEETLKQIDFINEEERHYLTHLKFAFQDLYWYLPENNEVSGLMTILEEMRFDTYDGKKSKITNVGELMEIALKYGVVQP